MPAAIPQTARRIVIAGGPDTGKTTLAAKLAAERKARHRGTDELIGTMGWSESSAAVSKWLDEPGPWVIEGAAAVRAIRKWLAAHPQGKPCDCVVLMTLPRAKRSTRQVGMAKGVLTVWREIVPALIERKVTLLYGR